MKQFILGEFADHTSCYGYQKKIAFMHLVADGDELAPDNRVGYVKTEPIVAEDGTITGEVFYYRGNAFPRHQARYFATSRALVAFMQAHLTEGKTQEHVGDFNELSGLDDDEDGEETIH
jgi:hypothetical protein